MTLRKIEVDIPDGEWCNKRSFRCIFLKQDWNHSIMFEARPDGYCNYFKQQLNYKLSYNRETFFCYKCKECKNWSE